MIYVSEREIRDILNKRWPNLINIWLFDKNYNAVSKAEFNNFLSQAETMPEFNFNNFDCDDFSLLMHAQIKLIASKDLTYSISFGEITIRHIISKEVHNLNILITDDRKALLFEPQANIFIDGINMEPFFVRI